MVKFKVGDRVVHPAHQEGPADTGTVAEVVERDRPPSYRVKYDTGVRFPDGRRLEKVSPTWFTEDELQPAD